MDGLSIKTLKRLFALSSNQCAFPQCGRAIVQPDGIVTGEICHISARNKNGPRYDPNISAAEINSYANLILLCEIHHKIVDADEEKYTIEWLQGIKAKHENDGSIELSVDDARRASQLLRSYLSISAAPKSKVMINSPGGIQTDKLNIITKKAKITTPPHPNSIAAHLEERNYIKYLIARYNEYQHADKEKVDRYKYMAISKAIKREFGAKWDEISIEYFDNLTNYLQHRIIKSKIGRIRNAHGQKCFSSYEEWLKKPEKP